MNPYLYEDKPLSPDEPNRDSVLGLLIKLLGLHKTILTHREDLIEAHRRALADTFVGWYTCCPTYRNRVIRIAGNRNLGNIIWELQ